MTQLAVVGKAQVSDPAGPDRAPWERQPGETERTYGMFQRYLALGYQRSQAKVAAEYDVSRQYISKIASERDWTDRLNAWLREQDRLWFEEMGEQRRNAMRRHANVAGAMMGVVAAQLRAVQLRAEQGTLTPNELARWVEVATRVEMLALGGATERFESEAGERTTHVVSTLARQIVESPEATEAALGLLDHLAMRSVQEGAS